jgi:hypothetical protein
VETMETNGDFSRKVEDRWYSKGNRDPMKPRKKLFEAGGPLKPDKFFKETKPKET